MANAITVALLYADTCKLAYTETHMSTEPRVPFDPSDGDDLADQAAEIADCAADLRNTNPSTLSEAWVHATHTQVQTSQALFDYINKTNGVPPAKQTIFDAVAAAVHLLRARELPRLHG